MKLCGGTKAYGTGEVLVKPHEEELSNFSKRKMSPDGYSNKCRECSKLYDSTRKKTEEPPKKMLCISCNKYKKSGDMSNHIRSKNGKSNTCRECVSKTSVMWSKNNRDRDLAKCSLRYARKKTSTVENVSRDSLVSKYGSTCYICGVETITDVKYKSEPNYRQVEHVIPLSRGGEHSYRNCRIVCLKCNTSKSNKTLYELVTKTGLPNTNLDTLLLYLSNAEWHGRYSQTIQLTTEQ